MTTINRRLASERLRNDPRLEQAKRLILETVADHQQTSRLGIRPPNPDLASDYQQLLDQFGELRGGGLYFPYLGSGIGNGPFVELADGSVKLDLITGIGVHGYGHSHPLLIRSRNGRGDRRHGDARQLAAEHQQLRSDQFACGDSLSVWWPNSNTVFSVPVARWRTRIR